MPRDLPISNGNLMINFDREYNIRDVYYPFVGQENQTVGDVSHFGVWCDGIFAWIDSPLWQKTLAYEDETLVTRVTATASALGLEIIIRDTIDFDRDLFLRRIDLTNLREGERKVRLYMNFDGHLWGNAIGDTVFYEPEQRSLVAYKGHRYVLMSGMVSDQFGFASFAIGAKERDGLQGTWRDAEDGNLGRNPIAQGSVDSTGMITFSFKETETAWFWWAFGKNYQEVSLLDSLVRQRGPQSFHDRTRDYWRLWVNKDGRRGLEDLPGAVSSLYKRSLLVLRTQINNNGAVIAGTDSDIVQFGRDTYTYMWPRDGALVVAALIDAGYSDVSRRFFEFCRPLFTPEGFLLHKYNPDGSVGSSWHPWSSTDGRRQLPIQEDETALVLWALWKHFERFRDIEFIRPLYRPMIKNVAEFLVRYREPHTKLPAPSYDLWEERRGILSFTVGAVWAGLQAAARFTDAFGERKNAEKYRSAADEIRKAAIKHLFDQKAGRFARMITVGPDGSISADVTMDASIAGLWQFGMLPANDSRIAATMDALISRLWVQTPIGGMARYEDDTYQQISRDIAKVPGNPWIICTLWCAEWYASRAEKERAVQSLEWTAQRALRSGVLAEQIDPYTGAPISVSPLTWSHAAFVSAVQAVAKALHPEPASDAGAAEDLYEKPVPSRRDPSPSGSR